ncbi:MAG: hypothetical protein KC442_11935 [Thermomicrobiales bacterium]|nr:hypothetical protein [Thermomicrobiales bacterium]MCB0059170.1 hypothetical protein [Caldilineaceae bacterium]
MVTLFKIRYPHAKWHEDDALTYRVWHMALEDLPTPAVMQVVPDLMRESVFPPDPADIRSRIFAHSGLLPEADQAWGMVVDQVKGRRDPATTPMTVKLCIKDIGGIFMLRQSEHPERDRDRFIKAYSARRREAMVDPQVVGMLDAAQLDQGAA